MADEIVLNVEVRERAGTGAARAARREGKVPGVLYGGKQGPVSIAVRGPEFRKALYTGKLLGHLVTLKYGKETQPVIAKEVQFHPVTDEPTHFDLYRVDATQQIRIAVAVHFRNEDESPGIKRGGVLNINVHALEVLAPANRIPEELIVDLTGLEIGDAIRAADVPLPEGVELVAQMADATVASIATSSALQSEEEEAAEAEAAAAEEGAEGAEGGEGAGAEEATSEKEE
ncbi:MAG TPA: 50S ribosomal protein L25/general stress protein Ctc [Caulobacteraceae bacterium]|jgi:large subunit ribosomal protein L25